MTDDELFVMYLLLNNVDKFFEKYPTDKVNFEDWELEDRKQREGMMNDN